MLGMRQYDVYQHVTIKIEFWDFREICEEFNVAILDFLLASNTFDDNFNRIRGNKNSLCLMS